VALKGPQYLDVIERPTEWTLSMRPSFRNFQRFPCTTLASEGVGIAAAVATSRFGAADAPASHVLSQTSSLLEDLLRSARLTSFHLGVFGGGSAVSDGQHTWRGSEARRRAVRIAG
jgi:hypothetical protein